MNKNAHHLFPIQYEFLRQFSADPGSTVIGLVRNKEAAEKKVAAELKRENVHFVQADMSDYESIKASNFMSLHTRSTQWECPLVLFKI